MSLSFTLTRTRPGHLATSLSFRMHCTALRTHKGKGQQHDCRVQREWGRVQSGAERDYLSSSCSCKVFSCAQPTSPLCPRPFVLAVLSPLALPLLAPSPTPNSAIAQTHFYYGLYGSAHYLFVLADLLLVSLTWCYTLSQDLVFVLFGSRVFFARSVLLFATTCACN